MSVALPKEKVDSIFQLCSQALSVSNVSVRDVATILGKFAWAAHAVPFAQAHYRDLQSWYINQARGGDMGKLTSLSDSCRRDLTWWLENLARVNGKPLKQNDPDLIIFSDSSLSGWGGYCNGVKTRGPWPLSDRSRHINELELIAAFNCLRAFANHATDLCILLQLDNATAVAYVNKRGGSRSAALNKIAIELIRWCEEKRIEIQAVYLPGSQNFIADQESRRQTDSSDWKLSPAVFAKIASTWELSVDLFASAWNAQLNQFVSWFPQPGAWRVNALSFSWKDLKAYAFPPFALIKDCLFKIRRESAEMVLICPHWPGQPWFPLLLELTTDIPIILPPHHQLLSSAEGHQHPLIETGSITLTAWKLSGVISQAEAFRRTWSTCCWREYVPPHKLLTSPPGRLGVIGVLNGISIPCRTL